MEAMAAFPKVSFDVPEQTPSMDVHYASSNLDFDNTNSDFGCTFLLQLCYIEDFVSGCHKVAWKIGNTVDIPCLAGLSSLTTFFFIASKNLQVT